MTTLVLRRMLTAAINHSPCSIVDVELVSRVKQHRQQVQQWKGLVEHFENAQLKKFLAVSQNACLDEKKKMLKDKWKESPNVTSSVNPSTIVEAQR